MNALVRLLCAVACVCLMAGPTSIPAMARPAPKAACDHVALDAADAEAVVAACSKLIDDAKVNKAGRVDALLVRGKAFGQLLQFEAAMADFALALSIAPDDPRIWTARGWAFLTFGNTERARSDFLQAVALPPELAEAFIGLGTADILSGDYMRAEMAFTTVIGIAPKSLDARIQRAQVYERTDRYGLAFADYEAAIAAGGNSGLPHVARGDAWFRLGDCDRARRDYSAAARIADTAAIAPSRMSAINAARTRGECTVSTLVADTGPEWLPGRWRKITSGSNAYCDDTWTIDTSAWPDISISGDDVFIISNIHSEATGIAETKPDGTVRVYQMVKGKRRELKDIKLEDGVLKVTELDFVLLFGPAKCKYRREP